ncbi:MULTISPECIES: TRAP transporter large permease subunit [unclassified Polaromonas]|jgi:GntP family gluconate:H+ symporter|uniref:TRAP transporter large permease n=1 Tax=unclassified Polaromonas TaxID=2638319 RepID=UPI000BD3338A|nr:MULTISPECIES: TRAP transporter large permease subunit [unclassified Polaromonas]OYY37863.1 MAG: C4-dicarboxylate ABC transporter [Polaromonas sp. 35-63-35]OYZ21044.1 MAG: C4-dicarboxylate ABC transporter [Polaromonas sp. 16-63-31]OYZ79413.1 MAG: C4-dicarboxylate ABC transporter [Polaromonas sp. 24-63-21]OZA50555.1 MAG: C4-dicarboxylate ABC transporter [Polaromonas sp. 17-63-33]OZA89419.1 MAG: C4-dicarboxylate ABC transporter [Polaromonas sp. 39-63-25]
MEFFIANLAPIMFMGLIVFLLMGFPVTFSLGACGLFFGFVGVELGVLPEALMQALPLRLFGIMQNDTLLAIPFFTLMGLVLERSGMAEDLLDTIGQLFGPLRGGLAIAVILVGALLAATTGVVAASVISMGLISLPIMLRYGYDRRIASGVIAASGTLAQIIPPSLVLIILADQLGRSVGDMYKGAFVPGFILTGMYVGYVFVLAFFKPQWVPALPAEARTIREDNGKAGLLSLLLLTIASAGSAVYFAKHYAEVQTWWKGETVTSVPLDETIVVSMCLGVILAFVIAVVNKVTRLGLLSRMAERVTFVLIPPLLLIFLVLGTIFLGIATPTEGGAMGAMGALIMAFARRRLNFSLLKQALNTTTKLSCFVVFILIGSTIFSLVFQGVDGPKWVEHLLSGLPGGQVGFLIVVNVLIFFLAFFLDFFELSFIVVPLLAPVAEKLGIDLIWFGVLLAVNMQTSFMHPPFGFALFYLRSVAPIKEYTDKVTKKLIQPVTTMQIYWGAVPFVLIQVVMVGLIIAFPGIVSSGLDKVEKIDLDKVILQVQEEPVEAVPVPGSAAEADAEQRLADDDPMKAMQDAMAKDKKK